MALKDIETKYTKCSDDVYVAYQVVGSGPIDLIMIPGWISHIEEAWNQPLLAKSFRRLASFSRLVLIDKRGTGLSDPIPTNEPPSLETRSQDIISVMDEIGSKKAAFFGISEGGVMCMHFAANHHDRVSHLIVYGTWAKAYAENGHDIGFDRVDFAKNFDYIEQGWGTGVTVPLLAPSLETNLEFNEWWSKFERISASKGIALKLLKMAFSGDIRPILGNITADTLVIHRRGDSLIDVRQSRYLAQHIPNASYIELDGNDHFPMGGDGAAIDKRVELFVTGQISSKNSETFMTNMVFTDIVGSTPLAEKLGTVKWKLLLKEHNNILMQQFRNYNGYVVNETGDGYLVIFDRTEDAANCCLEINGILEKTDLEIRIGIHQSEVGIIGNNISGLGVNTCSRIMSEAEGNQIYISNEVKTDLEKLGWNFMGGTLHKLKGIETEVELFDLNKLSQPKSDSA